MTHHAPPSPIPSGEDAGRQVARLRQVLLLVRRIAGATDEVEASESMLDQAARISGHYGDALPVVQRRFDVLAAETAAWAAAGVEALAARSGASPCSAAAGRLAEELDVALADLEALLGN